MPDVQSLIRLLLAARHSSLRLRSLAPIHPIDATHLQIGNQRFVNFCSNNYLGLNRHPRVLAAVESALRAAGFGSGAAGLLRGHTTIHASAAHAIALWKGTEDAILLPSGYQANLAAVQTLAAISNSTAGPSAVPPVRFLVDKLVHASVLDAVAATGIPPRVFPHNHLGKLTRLLSRTAAGGLDVVITESIFSMDGDAADLRGIAQIKKKRPFFLLLDEAHASGVYGEHGAGYAQSLGLQNAVDASVVTLSKALGGIGGAICASKTFCRAVVNFGRAYIYSTSIPPSAAAAAQAAIAVLRDEPRHQQRLADLSRRARSELAAAKINILPGDSPILCCLTGSESAALHAAKQLFNRGMLVAPVRPPTVAPGASRLRISLCSEHTDEEVTALLRAVKKLFPPGSPEVAHRRPVRTAAPSARINRPAVRRRITN